MAFKKRMFATLSGFYYDFVFDVKAVPYEVGELFAEYRLVRKGKSVFNTDTDKLDIVWKEVK